MRLEFLVHQPSLDVLELGKGVAFGIGQRGEANVMEIFLELADLIGAPIRDNGSG